MSTQGDIEGATFVTYGQVSLGYRLVTAAELAAADGLLTLNVSTPSVYCVVDSGSVIRGVRLVNGDGDDVTESVLTATTVFMVASRVAPYTITLEHEAAGLPAIADKHRLEIPSIAVPGTYGTGTIAQHQRVLAWRPDAQRWVVPQSAT